MPLIQNSKVLFEQDTQIKAIFCNGQMVWPAVLAPPPDPKNMPFSVRNMENTPIEFPAEPGYSYSLVEGEWENVYESGTITLDPGDTVRIRWVLQPRTSIDYLTFPWPSSNPRINIGGNIMSLLDGNNFVDLEEVGYHVFYSLFQWKAIDIDDLVLPATTLGQGCYQNMFSGCTSLTTAPDLPATTVVSNCYDNMFRSCTSLTTAPVLPATSLDYRSYAEMFSGCTSLNSVTCLATLLNTPNYATFNWLLNVSSTGTFTKAAGVTWPEGSNGIPSGWTVVEV